MGEGDGKPVSSTAYSIPSRTILFYSLECERLTEWGRLFSLSGHRVSCKGLSSLSRQLFFFFSSVCPFCLCYLALFCLCCSALLARLCFSALSLFACLSLSLPHQISYQQYIENIKIISCKIEIGNRSVFQDASRPISALTY